MSPISNRRLARAYDLIADKLALVEEELLLHFRSPVPTIDRIGSYLAAGGGKRIRPALLLLSARLLGYDRGEKDVRYATVVEFIHTATLVHDDVIDEASLRRGRTSANARWGNNLTVLFGDYLYTKSMGIALDEGDLTILKVLSDTTLAMIEGEIIAIEKLGSIQVTREETLEITRRKNGRPLLRSLPDSGALRAGRRSDRGRAPGRVRAMPGRGLPADRRPARLHRQRRSRRKTVLNDLREGKLTMPLILALPRASASERERVATVLAERDFRSVSSDQVLEIAERYDGIAETRALARDYAGAARVALGAFPDSEAKDGLLLATESVIDRVS
jgi:octaprenyl-diphosphate synthase